MPNQPDGIGPPFELGSAHHSLSTFIIIRKKDRSGNNGYGWYVGGGWLLTANVSELLFFIRSATIVSITLMVVMLDES